MSLKFFMIKIPSSTWYHALPNERSFNWRVNRWWGWYETENQALLSWIRYLTWIIQDICAQKRTSKTAEVVGENGRLIKLVFVIAYDRYWNGNALNSGDALNCYYEDIYLSSALNEVVYDSTVRAEKGRFPFLYWLSQRVWNLCTPYWLNQISLEKS